MNKLIYALTVLCVALPVQVSAAQADRMVSGSVLDQQGLPVIGAMITITQRQGNVNRSAESSAMGFQIDALLPGQYDMRIEAAGFEPQDLTVDLRTVATSS